MQLELLKNSIIRALIALIVVQIAVEIIFGASSVTPLLYFCGGLLVIGAVLAVPCYFLFAASRNYYGKVTSPGVFGLGESIFKVALTFFGLGMVSLIILIVLALWFGIHQ